MQEPPLYNQLEEKVRQLDAKLNRLLQDYRIGGSLTGPFPVSETFMSLRRIDGTRCYMPGVYGPPGSGWGTNSWAKDLLMVFPFYVGARHSIDRLSFYVHVAAVGSTRMGVYNSSRDLYPTNLVVDAGISSHNSVGFRDISFGKVSLTRGLKWIAILQQGAPTITSVLPEDIWAILGRVQGTAQLCGWTVAYGYAALPAMYPAGATMMSGASGLPLIEMRLLK